MLKDCPFWIRVRESATFVKGGEARETLVGACSGIGPLCSGKWRRFGCSEMV